MSDQARADILARIRTSLGVSSQETDRRATVTDRLMRPPRGVIPKRGQLPKPERIDLFQAMAEKYDAVVERVTDYASIPEAIAGYLRRHNLPAEIRHGTDSRLTGLPWDNAPNIAHSTGIATGKELAGLSHAFGGVAESGTLLLASGPENPTTINFLSDHHIVIVHVDDIAGDYETAWQANRTKNGSGRLPRAVNMVTGPSRSADIAQTLILGAHGPRALHILIVGGDKGTAD